MPQQIFMLGIGGAGMRALAALLHSRGHTITGTDFDYEKITTNHQLSTYVTAPEREASDLLKKADLVVYTDAAPKTHPLRQEAARLGIRQQMLFEAAGEFSRDFTTIAVTGTHGKSSTTAMMGHILIAAGLDPTVQVGASVPGWKYDNARTGQGNYFVVEADEYRRHFLHLKPQHIITTSIDFDHPDYFHSLEDVTQAYAEFFRSLSPQGWLVTTQEVRAQHPDLPWPQHVVIVPPPTSPIVLSLPGRHMQYNAALAIAMAEKLGVARTDALRALATFPGLSRRFEIIGTRGSTQIISDYGHHPTEIAATLQAAREHYPREKIVAIVEPHTTERVTAFGEAFVSALRHAPIDGIVIYPTFYVKGRENEGTALASSLRLYNAIAAHRSDVWHVNNNKEITQFFDEYADRYTIAICFTAGSLDAFIRTLV